MPSEAQAGVSRPHQSSEPSLEYSSLISLQNPLQNTLAGVRILQNTLFISPQNPLQNTQEYSRILLSLVLRMLSRILNSFVLRALRNTLHQNTLNRNSLQNLNTSVTQKDFMSNAFLILSIFRTVYSRVDQEGWQQKYWDCNP